MSDSGRQIGDCPHGKTPRACVECLCRRVAELERTIAQLSERLAAAREALGRAAERRDLDALVEAERERNAAHIEHCAKVA